jgi:hypothetical protein
MNPFKYFPLLTMAVVTMAFMSLPTLSHAAAYFVRDTLMESDVNETHARAAASLIRDAVSARSGDILVRDEYRADYILQPRLMRLGESLVLTVEKIRGEETLFAAQVKVNRIEQLDSASRAATNAAIDEPSLPSPRSIASVEVPPIVPYRAPQTTEPQPPFPPQPPSVGEARARSIDVLPDDRKVSYWTMGVGPFLSRRLASDNLMYNFTVGHTWDINPAASVKLLGDAFFSSGGDRARLFNVATGASVFLPSESPDTATYLTGDLGYGFTTDATGEDGDGFSFGTGVGVQFFRTTETTLDLLLRYSVVFDPSDDEGDPSTIGLRLAVNF